MTLFFPVMQPITIIFIYQLNDQTALGVISYSPTLAGGTEPTDQGGLVLGGGGGVGETGSKED